MAFSSVNGVKLFSAFNATAKWWGSNITLGTTQSLLFTSEHQRDARHKSGDIRAARASLHVADRWADVLLWRWEEPRIREFTEKSIKSAQKMSHYITDVLYQKIQFLSVEILLRFSFCNNNNNSLDILIFIIHINSFSEEFSVF